MWKGKELESDLELHFIWLLEELKEFGYVKFWRYEPVTFPLSDKVNYTYTKQLKTKEKEVSKVLMQGHSYTPDFIVGFEDIAEEALFTKTGDLKEFPFIVQGENNNCIIEIKPTFDQNNMTRAFKINQAFMWSMHNKYVNLVKLGGENSWFGKWFTPKKFLTTSTGKPRKINHSIVTVEEWINDRRRKNEEATLGLS